MFYKNVTRFHLRMSMKEVTHVEVDDICIRVGRPVEQSNYRDDWVKSTHRIKNRQHCALDKRK